MLGRFSFRVQDREGQLRNEYLGGEYVDYKESAAFRGRVTLTPADRWSVDLRAHYLDQDGGSGYFMPGSDFFLPLPPPNEPIIVDVPEYEIQSNKLGESFVKSKEVSAKIDYDLGWGTLTSITSFLLVGFKTTSATARLAARRALLITVAGGLVLLAGFVLLVDATEAFEAGGKAAALQAAEEAAGPFRLLGDDYFKVDSSGFINQEYPTKSSRAAAIVLQASAGQGCDLAIVFQQMNVGEGGMSARIRFYLAERTP